MLDDAIYKMHDSLERAVMYKRLKVYYMSRPGSSLPGSNDNVVCEPAAKSLLSAHIELGAHSESTSEASHHQVFIKFSEHRSTEMEEIKEICYFFLLLIVFTSQVIASSRPFPVFAEHCAIVQVRVLGIFFNCKALMIAAGFMALTKSCLFARIRTGTPANLESSRSLPSSEPASSTRF
mmetsp:Transcript_12597/g.17514  ORF Transcript_12597/g.17514 Transcript_12597/m.17514 type:complete len:179 (+) Transcript_12597:81-617(+)